MLGKEKLSISTFKNWAVAIGIGLVAAPSWSESACPGVSSSYHDRNYDISMVRCISQPIAACTINVIAKFDGVWDMSGENRLVDNNGVAIPAVSITMGGVENSVPSRNAQPVLAGISTKIDIKFGQAIKPNETDAICVLVVYVGHWSARKIKLEPHWVE